MRPVILTFVCYYLPGYKAGGPLRTIANMVERLGDEFEFRIVTSDRDATDTEPYADVANGGWIKVGKAEVLYLSPAQKRLYQIAKILRDTSHDVLYLNSFFDPDFTQKPLLARRLGLAPETRCVIAPRGEFSDGALRLKSGKKKIFLQTARAVGLYRDLVWQASSVHEQADIRRVLGSLARRIKIAIDLPEVTPRQPTFVPRTAGEPLRVCFLSRISPKKNLDFALKVLRRVQVPVRFNIYGLIDDEAYWKECQGLIGALPEAVIATYCGSIPHAKVAEILARHDLFFLPTRGENYGHAIFEALSVGTPVLIANTTPWRSLAKLGLGWDLPLEDSASFARVFSELDNIALNQYADFRQRCADFIKRTLESDAGIAASKELFAQSHYVV